MEEIFIYLNINLINFINVVFIFIDGEMIFWIVVLEFKFRFMWFRDDVFLNIFVCYVCWDLFVFFVGFD